MNEIWIKRKCFEQEKYKCIVNPDLINGGLFLALLVISNELTWFFILPNDIGPRWYDVWYIASAFQVVASNCPEVSTLATLVMSRVDVTFAR